MFNTKREILFTILTGFFVTNAIVGELIGGKLIEIDALRIVLMDYGLFRLSISTGALPLSIGIIPWPIVFLATDIINEYYGKSGVKRLTFMTAGLITYVFVILFIGMHIKSTSFSPVSDEDFNKVFGQSMWIIVGSLTAFMTSQIVDIVIFWLIRKHTGSKMIWLRSTGSTAVSQLIDSFIVTGIAFYLTGKLTFNEYISTAFTGYSVKLFIAILITPLIYLGHNLIHRYLGEEESEKIIAQTASEVLHLKTNSKNNTDH